MNRRTRFRLWLLDVIPDGVLARPAEWLLTSLCLVSAATTLAGAQPDSVTISLPWLMRVMWALCLVVGATAWAVGISSIEQTLRGDHVVLRVPAYRLGMRLLGVASLVFGGALLREGGVLESLPVLLFSVMCYLRLLTLGGR